MYTLILIELLKKSMKIKFVFISFKKSTLVMVKEQKKDQGNVLL